MVEGTSLLSALPLSWGGSLRYSTPGPCTCRPGVSLIDCAAAAVVVHLSRAVQAATHYDLNENGIVSVEEFRLALNEYTDSVAEGVRPDWF